MTAFTQSWPMPSSPRQVIILGTGGIVRDSHMPAYRKYGIPVAGIWNRNMDRAHAVANEFSIDNVYGSVEEATQRSDVIYDIATSPAAYVALLESIPEGSAVLIQKPLGLNLAEANEILKVCRNRKLVAAVNFQLRFSPMMLAIRDALKTGFFGTLTEVEVHLNLLTPWEQFPNLSGDPRVEIVAHSVHYIDLIQSLIGVPKGVFARSFSFPGSDLSDTRTSAILEYEAPLRVTMSINHHHDFGRSQQTSTIRFEGDKGAAVAKLGVLLDYPKGEPDDLWMGARGTTLSQINLGGYWFPDAFGYTMANLQRFAAGEDNTLETSVESAWKTMAIVEACYRSATRPTEPVDNIEDLE